MKLLNFFNLLVLVCFAGLCVFLFFSMFKKTVNIKLYIISLSLQSAKEWVAPEYDYTSEEQRKTWVPLGGVDVSIKTEFESSDNSIRIYPNCALFYNIESPDESLYLEAYGGFSNGPNLDNAEGKCDDLFFKNEALQFYLNRKVLGGFTLNESTPRSFYLWRTKKDDMPIKNRMIKFKVQYTGKDNGKEIISNTVYVYSAIK